MPSCLGLYTDKNIIKYAKVTADKTTNRYNIEAFGVKFYDNIQATVDEIANEVGMEFGPISIALSHEDYYVTQVFSNLKRKDMTDLITSEYLNKQGEDGVPASVLDIRFQLAQNIEVLDKHLAICVSTSKGQLANINQTYENYKIASISPMAISIKNLFENEGIDEEAAVINIEDKTTVTIFHRSEIQYVEAIPLGAQEIINKLAEKYNSYSKAYEACKKISAYLEDAYDMDDESRDILDVVIPILYDIRQRVENILTPYAKKLKKIYISGTGAIISNIDIYFHEMFLDLECEILKPFFVRRDTSNLKDVVEVNSAIALALDGIGMVSKDLDFNAAAKKNVEVNIKSISKKLGLREKKAALKAKIDEIVKRLNAPPGYNRKRKRRNVKVDFDDGISTIGVASEPEEIPMIKGFGVLELWLQRFAILGVSALVIYSVASISTNNLIAEKNSLVAKEIAKANETIAAANSDATYLNGLANDYVEITEKLAALIAKINEETVATSFDIPNFLSKLMFIMPANVQITSIDVSNTGNVQMHAVSGQYAQLGYFVSRVKLEKALLNVDMEVVSVDSNIKIIVSGVLP